MTTTPLAMAPLHRPAPTAPAPSTSTVERLLSLSSEDFATVVSNDVRRKANPNTVKALRDPRVWQRWEDALWSLLVRVDGQLESQRAARDAKWKLAVSTFRKHAESRLAEVRVLRAGSAVTP
jgi:hypothetical protein